MKLNIKMNLVRKVKYHYSSFTIDTHDYPTLEGKTLDEIRVFIENHADQMHPMNEKFNRLLEEISTHRKEVILEEFPAESGFYVTTEEEEEIV